MATVGFRLRFGRRALGHRRVHAVDLATASPFAMGAADPDANRSMSPGYGHSICSFSLPGARKLRSFFAINPFLTSFHFWSPDFIFNLDWISVSKKTKNDETWMDLLSFFLGDFCFAVAKSLTFHQLWLSILQDSRPVPVLSSEQAKQGPARIKGKHTRSGILKISHDYCSDSIIITHHQPA